MRRISKELSTLQYEVIRRLPKEKAKQVFDQITEVGMALIPVAERGYDEYFKNKMDKNFEQVWKEERGE